MEDLDNERELQILASIMKELFFSYDSGMIKLLLQEDNYIWLLAGLEYKHEELGYKKEEYREYMKGVANHLSIYQINDEEVLSRIHQNYKISYLRDSIIASYIDDNLSN
jgi:protein phosphatase 4 regulatory subunit 3